MCANIPYPERKLPLGDSQVWHVLGNTSGRFLSPHNIDIAVGDEFCDLAL